MLRVAPLAVVAVLFSALVVLSGERAAITLAESHHLECVLAQKAVVLDVVHVLERATELSKPAFTFTGEDEVAHKLLLVVITV